MDAYTELLSEEGKAAIPTDPDSPASPELLPSYRDRQVLGLVVCIGLERPPSNKSNGIVTIALYSHNNLYLFQTKPFDMDIRYTR